jgi:2'-5' RNA ligase
MRLFFAVPIPASPGLTAILSDLKNRHPRGRWTPPENLHLTLKFLGETSEAEARKASEAARSAFAKAAPFTVSLGKPGAFRAPRGVGALWLGVEEGRESLAALAAVLDEALGRAGFPREDRPFRPHLTLGRFSGPGPARESVSVPGAERYPADRALLMQSVFAQGRPPAYTAIHSFPFGA